MTPDINILVAASRTDHVHHKSAYGWLSGAMARCETGGSIEVLPMVAAGFLRMVTNARVFVDPTPGDSAVAFLDSMLAVPGVELQEVGREWPTLRTLVAEHQLAGNAIPDAWIAAAVRTLGSHLVTFDRSFNRWLSRAELTVLDPTHQDSVRQGVYR